MLAVCFICLGSAEYLSFHYSHSGVRSPEPEMHRTTVLNVHGTIVYITPQENRKLSLLFWIGCASGLGAGGVNLLGKKNLWEILKIRSEEK